VPDVRPVRRCCTAAQRFEGLAGSRRGFTLTVVALVTLASVPTFAATTAGTVSLETGQPRRPPFVVAKPGPPVVVVPDRDIAAPPAAVRRRQVAPPMEPVRPHTSVPVPRSRPAEKRAADPPLRTQAEHPSVAKRPKRGHDCVRGRWERRASRRQHWQPTPSAARSTRCHVPGRGIPGWRTPPRPRR
jgi:hypothetical protein